MNQFQRTIVALQDAAVAFVVIGGAAMTVHGSAHITYDLDIAYSRSREDIERLVRALAPYRPRLRGAPSSLPFHWDAGTVARGLNFRLATDLGDIDLWGEVAGIGTHPDVLAASIALEIFRRPCHVLSLEGLIRAKRAAGRPRDLLALPELEALSEIEIHLAGERAARQGRPHQAGELGAKDEAKSLRSAGGRR